MKLNLGFPKRRATLHVVRSGLLRLLMVGPAMAGGAAPAFGADFDCLIEPRQGIFEEAVSRKVRRISGLMLEQV